MTTDTKVKQSSIKFDVDEVEVAIAACAKGSGMIMPNMATMLSVVITDVVISHDLLQKALSESVEDTFNCITVDGDTSTNDSIFFLQMEWLKIRKLKVKKIEIIESFDPTAIL